MSRSNLGIDARMLHAVTGTGVSTYARSLLAAATLLDRTPVLIRDDGPRFGDIARTARAMSPVPRRLVSIDRPDTHERTLVAADIFRMAQVHFRIFGKVLPLRAPGPAGIMHWTYPLPLRLVGWKNVYTVHDAIPLTQPDLTPIGADRHRRMLAAIGRHASAIVTVSADARAAIVAATGWSETRVIDCGQPVIVPPLPLPPPTGFASGSYFLFCGSIEPRKNLVRLANAYRASRARLPLLLVGPDSWRTEEILSTIISDDAITRLTYQNRDELLRLIAHARAMLFPSLAEGFGLPVAEAMGLGTPVMTTAGGALGETASGAAMLVDPYDEGMMAEAISRLSRDDALVADLAERGRMRAQAFSLEQFACRLDALYKSL